MMRATKTQQNVFLRIAKAPFRALCKARDLYVRSMASCAASVGHGDAGYDALPRSFSMGSSRIDNTDDFKELLRAVSMKSLGRDHIDVDAVLKELKANNNNNPAVPKISKSCSVGMHPHMGRIDEEKADEFGEEEDREDGIVKLGKLPMRSRSYAHAGSRTAPVF